MENLKQFAKVADDPKKRRKLVRKKVPDGMVPWSEATMNRLIESEPEKLTSHMRVSTAMILDVVDRPGDPVAAMRRLLTENHEPRHDSCGDPRGDRYRPLAAAGRRPRAAPSPNRTDGATT